MLMKKSLLYSLFATTVIAASATVITAAEGDPEPASQGGYVLSVNPSTGSTVKSISEIKILLPAEYMEETSVDANFDVSSITLTKEGDPTPIKASGFGEGGMTADGMFIYTPVQFSPITEPGTYKLVVPAGLFIQMDINSWTPVENGKKSETVSAKYTISADAASKFDKYVLDPASGESVPAIESVELTFPGLDFSAAIYNSVEGKEISFTNGNKTYYAYAQCDWNYEDAKRFRIIPTDAQSIVAEGQDFTISEAGTWYLYIEQGAFSLEGEESPEIMAQYTIGSAAASLDDYVLTPAANAEVGRLRSVKITFPGYNMMSELYVADNAQPATISNGQKTYTADSSPLWENMNAKEFEFTFSDNDSNPVSITEDGVWTLNIPAGYFEAGAAKSGEISATYVVDSSIQPVINWTAYPENGSAIETPQGMVSDFYFNFQDIESVSYDQADSNEIVGIRVSYNGQDIKSVKSALGTEEDNIGWQLYDNYGDACAVIRINTAVFRQPGTLSIEIDKGRFTLDDGIASPEIIYSCTVGDYKKYSYKLLPENTESVNDLTEFTLSFPDAQTATINKDLLYITLSSGAWAAPGNPEVTAVDGAEHPTFSIKYASNPDKNGNYTLMIDEGSFTLDGNTPSSIIEQTYTFSKGTAVNWEWLPSPDTDLIIDNGIFAAFKFDDNETLGYGPEYNNITVVLNGTELTAGQYEKGMSGDNNAVYFGITDETLLVPSTLKITLPEGAIMLSGETNANPITYTWNVRQPKEYTCTLAPDAGTVSSLTEIKLTINGAETAEVTRTSGISMMGNNYSYYANAEIVKDAANPRTFILKFPTESVNGPMTDGEYKLEIFGGTFTIDGAQSWPAKPIEKVYTLHMTSGIDGINADNGTVTVISIDGKVVLKDAPASELKNLDKGIYIINGKKRIIK